jgi:outer membrane protein assembly factor BamB
MYGYLVTPKEWNAIFDYCRRMIDLILRYPPIRISWFTVGAYVASTDPDYPLRSKTMQKSCVHEYGKGEIVTELKLKWRYGCSDWLRSSVNADIDNDGEIETITGDLSGYVYCIKPDGTLKWSMIPGYEGSYVWYLTVYDVDRDGKMEVLATCFYVSETVEGALYCIGHDGVVKWGHWSGCSPHISTQSACDVDGDGYVEVIYGDSCGRIWCLNGSNGSTKWVYYAPATDYVQGTATADVDGDKEVEVLASVWTGYVVCLRGVNGALKWIYNTPETDCQSMNVYDVDGDGKLEVLHDTWHPGYLYCHEHDGTVKWHSAIASYCWSPVVGSYDIDNDGVVECLEGDYSYNMNCLRCDTGEMKWRYLTRDRVSTGGCMADLDNDGYMEVVFGSNDYKLYVLEHNGTLKASYTTEGNVADIGCVSIFDIDGDGKLEILAPSKDFYMYCLE